MPPGPSKRYKTDEDLLSWTGRQFKRFGDIYKATIYGSNVYVTRAPDHAERVLRENWQNYVKGQAIKRVALLLGDGLIASEGELWKHQRRLVQPAFHRKAISSLEFDSESEWLIKRVPTVAKVA
jgi:cytochrome P450